MASSICTWFSGSAALVASSRMSKGGSWRMARAMALLADGEALRRMSENLEKLARPDAAERIVDEIEKVMK